MKTLKNKLCILFSAILAVACGVFGVSALQPQKAEAEATPAVTIESNNLSYSDSLYLIYAVSNEGFDRKQNQIQLLFWEEPQEEYTYGTQDSVVTTNDKATVKGKDCLIYYSRGLAAKEMTTDLYARAYVNIDGMAYYSEVSKFSVWDYVYTMRDYNTVDSTTDTLFTKMLDYGAQAQLKFNHKTDKLANTPYYKITVENGTLANGNTLGRYFTGESVTMTANPAPEGKVFFYWRDSAGTIVSREASYTISASAHESYTAVYMDADSTAWSQGLSFSLKLGGASYTVTGIGTCTDLALSIPAMYNDKPVTAISSSAFQNKTTITSVVIPDSVTTIGDYAFRDCTSLTGVNIGDGVTTIAYGMFYNCSSLTSVVIPDSVISIGEYAFAHCSSLTSVIIPDSVATIGYGAFYNCTSLTSVVIPDSVTSIGSYAFSCSSLTAVYITDIEAWCNISFDDSTANPLYYAKNLYLNNELVTELVIPNTITEIKAYAFDGCSSLTSVVIPDSVTSIGNYAFEYCSSLTSVVIPDSVTSIGERAFYNCSRLATVYYGGTASE